MIREAGKKFYAWLMARDEAAKAAQPPAPVNPYGGITDHLTYKSVVAEREPRFKPPASMSHFTPCGEIPLGPPEPLPAMSGDMPKKPRIVYDEKDLEGLSYLFKEGDVVRIQTSGKCFLFIDDEWMEYHTHDGKEIARQEREEREAERARKETERLHAIAMAAEAAQRARELEMAEIDAFYALEDNYGAF